ncbi:MAG: FkbM family methyltransferase [Hyphomonadaceae bacterium]
MEGIQALANLVDRNARLCIYDVGAHHGFVLAELLATFPNAEVYAFEPDAANFAKLTARYGDTPRVRLFDVGLADRDGQAQLHRNNYDATHSLLPMEPGAMNRWADASDVREVAVQTVPVRSLDSLVSAGETPWPDLVKLDMQGGEAMFLKGAENALRQQRITGVLCEAEFVRLYRDQPTAWDIHGLFDGYGYKFVNFLDAKVRSGVMVWADALYCSDAGWVRLEQQHAQS